jgi:potassium-transporting ATPase KdpC subunit
MRRQLVPAIAMLLVLTVLTGLLYPLVVTGVARGLFPDQANGSLIRDASGRVVGSELIGQPFNARQYFHPRPSAAGDGYDGSASSGSNYGPTNPDFLAQVEQRAAVYRQINGLAPGVNVPVDAVTASASGLDPHISVANARLQAPRVAEARGLPRREVEALIATQTDERALGFLGEPGVNVLRLNLALDDIANRDIADG